MQNEDRMKERPTDELSTMSKTLVELKKRTAQHEDTIETLTHYQQEYRIILENSLDAIFFTDPTANGRILFANQEACRMFGFTEEEILEADRDAVLDTGDPRLADMLEARERGETFRGELTYKRKDGSLFLGELTSSKFKDREDHPRAVTVVRDITERKQLEEELRESKARLDLALESASMGVWHWDINQDRCYFDDQVCSLLGIEPATFTGTADEFFNAVHPDDREMVRAALARTTEQGVPYEPEYRALWLDGSVHYITARGRLVRNDTSNRPERINGIVWDITDRKHTEEALQKAHDSLELRVQERTTELSQAYEALQHEMDDRGRIESQLRQSQKMEAIGTLAGGIAHDFNNLLAAILGFAEMAAEDVADRPEAERNIRIVLKSAMRARELVKQILAFSRKTSHEGTPLSLSSVITETVHLLRASIPSTIEITLTNTATSDTILATPIEIQQILMNLATNASLAMQDTGGTLEVSLTDIDFKPDSPVLGPDVIPGEYLQLLVKDTGIGMSPDVVKRVFEPFFTTREVGKGTGMGLAVVYGMVKDLQGTITVESSPGVGAIFRVFLPKVKTQLKEDQPQTAHIPGGKERILFLDDEDMLVEWGETVLKRLGYQVTALTDSTEALKTFSSDPTLFNLVITDQTMPGIPGLQLSKEFLKIRPDIPIILCTGHSDTVSSETAKEAGVSEFLMKPLVKQELAQVVRRLLDTKSDVGAAIRVSICNP